MNVEKLRKPNILGTIIINKYRKNTKKVVHQRGSDMCFDSFKKNP